MSDRTINTTTMDEHCSLIKDYLLAYNNNDVNITLYGDKVQELKKIIEKENNEEMFFLGVQELIGGVTRVLQANYRDLPNIYWMGGYGESFTRQYFIETMKTTWPELY